MTTQMRLAFWADSAQEAVEAAKAWVHAEPKLRLRTIARVETDTRNERRYIVTVAVSAEPGAIVVIPMEMGL